MELADLKNIPVAELWLNSHSHKFLDINVDVKVVHLVNDCQKIENSLLFFVAYL